VEQAIASSLDSTDPRPSWMKSMRLALVKLEKGSFVPALDDVNEALRQIVPTLKAGYPSTAVRIISCYKLALNLLTEVKGLERNPANKPQVAFYTLLLASLPFFAKHRVICTRMSVSKNLDVGNNGIAARLLQTLLAHDLPDKAGLESKLERCNAAGLKDNTPPPSFQCPVCSKDVPGQLVDCPPCGHEPCFCFLSYQIITTPSIPCCLACSATFAASRATAGTTCAVCGIGQIISVPAADYCS